MSTLTIDLPEEDLQTIKSWTAARGQTLESWLTHQARYFREAAKRPLHPHVVAATGIFPADIDLREAYLDAMEEKHR